MNAQEWLYAATFDMPRSVRERVKAETLEHLQEAGVQDNAEVLSVLGSPREVRQQLAQTYVTEQRWQQLEKASPDALKVGAGILATALILKVYAVGFDPAALRSAGLDEALWPHYQGPVLGLIFYGLLAAALRTSSAGLRHYLSRRLGWVPLLVGLALGALIGFHLISSGLLLAYVAAASAQAWREKGKFERTWQLESSAQD